jgi:membrane protein YdbS with pleckstrin-like domain
MTTPEGSAPAAPTRTVDQAFMPEGEPWQRVSPVLAKAYRIELALWTGLGLVLIALLRLIPGFPVLVQLVLAGSLLVAFLWAWIVIGRRVRSWGYAEREDDLLVTSGILFRRLVIVPYGRMQLVDLTAGPLHRALGITTVQLHTAAATTDASIPGLTPDVAAGLRDRLARRGEQRSAGL